MVELSVSFTDAVGHELKNRRSDFIAVTNS